MRHRIIEGLIEKVQKSIETQRRAQSDMDLLNEESDIRAIAHYRVKGRRVWSVEYDAYCWYLYHYDVPLLKFNEETGEVDEWVDTISVSDQQGMNGFLSALGVNYYVRRAGRTARYV